MFYFPSISLLNIREHNMAHVFHAEHPEENSAVWKIIWDQFWACVFNRKHPLNLAVGTTAAADSISLGWCDWMSEQSFMFVFTSGLGCCNCQANIPNPTGVWIKTTVACLQIQQTKSNISIKLCLMTGLLIFFVCLFVCKINKLVIFVESSLWQTHFCSC